MDNRPHLNRILSLACILGLFLTLLSLPAPRQASAATTVIDYFDDTNSVTVTVDGQIVRRSYTGVNAIGGVRKVQLWKQAGTAGSSVTVATTAGNPGNLSFSSNAGRGQMKVAYDATPETDANATYTLNRTGISPAIDLTDAGNDTMLYMSISNDDQAVPVRVLVYSGTTACSFLEKYTPGGVDGTTLPVIIAFPINQFTSPGGSCTSEADFTAVTAVEVIIAGLTNLDLNFRLFSPGDADYGDAYIYGGDAYNTVLTDMGVIAYVAGHMINSNLYLGSQIDAEQDGQPLNLAVYDVRGGDDRNGVDDEDGVFLSNQPWTPGSDTGGRITYDVVGDGCFYGWIDWGMDGTFDNWATLSDGSGGDLVLDSVSVTTGHYNVNIVVPSTAPTHVNARFRLYPRMPDDSCAPQYPDMTAVFGEGILVEGGEVEDYYWRINKTTAVNVIDFHASPAVPSGLLLQWTTTNEIDTVGFNLYRSETADGVYTMLNPAMIAALTPGESTGNRYSFTDAGAQLGVRYFYKLETITASLDSDLAPNLAEGAYFRTFIPWLIR